MLLFGRIPGIAGAIGRNNGGKRNGEAAASDCSPENLASSIPTGPTTGGIFRAIDRLLHDQPVEGRVVRFVHVEEGLLSRI